MRLSQTTQNTIKKEVANLLSDDCRILLFGSRVDDNQRGGDIDLLIETSQPIDNRVELECKLAARLYIKLGGRKVDVLLKYGRSESKPIYQQTMSYGVRI